jgi:hypothetical protein
MRSATSTHRRLHARQSPRPRLEAVARLVDEGTLDDPDHLLVHVVDDGDDLLLGLLPVEVGTHPFDELAGCTAPPEWSIFGMRVRGTAHHLDQAHGPEPTSTTFLVDRTGAECSILRTSTGTMAVAGPAEGTIPDLCRRVLGLPTPPPPASTAGLWTVAWLDRLVEALGDPAHRAGLAAAWAPIAALHPAAAAAPALDLDDPRSLVRVARAHAAEWPWARLRAEPERLVLPGGALPRAITTWMDDGFYARWALGAFPHPITLAHDLTGLLDASLRQPFLDALEAMLRAGG